MTSTSRLLERILVQFQELDDGSTSFILTAIIVLSLTLVFVAHRIRDKPRKATLSSSVPTANRSSGMLSSKTAKAAPPTGSVTVSKILIHPIKVSLIISIFSLKEYLNGRRCHNQLFLY
jgi:hypothetical protein